jgi:prepilin-type processing-associated H-X9-DG protein
MPPLATEFTFIENIAKTQGVVKTDYAANAGDSYTTATAGDTITMGQPGNYAESIPGGRIPPPFPLWEGYCEDPTRKEYQTGISYYRSRMEMKRIEDGASNTYMVGEKWLPVDAYDGSADPPITLQATWGENQSMYHGYEWDQHRGAFPLAEIRTPNNLRPTAEPYQPSQDQAGVAGAFPEVKFGSAHSGGFNMVFCDGSVRSIPYEIETNVHSRLACRLDGNAVAIP